jgi:hypothetical protein
MSAGLTNSHGEHPEGVDLNDGKQQVRIYRWIAQNSEEETAQGKTLNLTN